MQQIPSQCTNCGGFPRRSLLHEEGYQSSTLIERLRTSNFAATDDEITHIRHIILPTVSDDISSIDSKVVSLYEAIRLMEEERARLTNVQKKYNNLISSQRAIPLEIWSTIFLYTLSGDSDFNAFDASGSMWRLSHVCQKWRNVALSLQSFWSTMELHFPRAARKEVHVERLEAVLQRSHQGLLDVSLLDHPTNPSSDPLILKRMLDIIRAESFRWQKLRVIDWRGHLTMLYASLPSRLPCLESVCLICTSVENNWVVATFEDCPCLRKLTLGGTPPRVQCPWGQITELDFSGMDFDGSEVDRRACMRMIGLCPSLETLYAPYCYLEEIEAESRYTPTTCLNVRKLCTISVHVIDALTLPRLREVSLSPELSIHHDVALRSVEQLLIRSNSLHTLASLSLSCVPLASLPGHTLHSLLSQTHGLSFLDLNVYRQEFDQMDATSDQGQIVALVKSLEVVPETRVTFLPLLSSLNICIRQHLDEGNLPDFGPIGSLASTVKARWRGDSKIGLARLGSCCFTVQARHLRDRIFRGQEFMPSVFDAAERSIFNALVDEGMNLVIRVTSDWGANTAAERVVFAVP